MDYTYVYTLKDGEVRVGQYKNVARLYLKNNILSKVHTDGLVFDTELAEGEHIKVMDVHGNVVIDFKVPEKEEKTPFMYYDGPPVPFPGYWPHYVDPATWTGSPPPAPEPTTCVTEEYTVAAADDPVVFGAEIKKEDGQVKTPEWSEADIRDINNGYWNHKYKNYAAW